MHRGIAFAAAMCSAAVLVLAAGPRATAWAQPGAATPEPASAPASAATNSSQDSSVEDEATEAEKPSAQQLGVRLGVGGGGRVTPGGLYLGGVYLYRLTKADWFETGVSFSFGGGGTTCFRDRDAELICDQGRLAGFSGEASAGVRRMLLGKGKLTPYLRAGVSFRFVNFGDDELKGVAVPVWAGGGVRAEVTPGVSVVGDASLHVGPAWMGRGLGLEPQASFIVVFGAEFRVD